MELSYSNEKEIKEKEDEDKMLENPTFKLVSAIFGEIFKFTFKFFVFDLLMTYAFSFNIFDMVFDYFQFFFFAKYPLRLVFAPLLLIGGMTLIGSLYIMVQSLVQLKSPLYFLKIAAQNYYQKAQEVDYRKKV